VLLSGWHLADGIVDRPDESDERRGRGRGLAEALKALVKLATLEQQVQSEGQKGEGPEGGQQPVRKRAVLRPAARR